jgi:hypothetical protein
MFNPDNAAALRQMKTQLPEVFDHVSSVEMRDMVKASKGADGQLDVSKFIKKVNEMPEPTRKLMFSAGELAAFKNVETNPKLARIKELTDSIGKGVHTPGGPQSHLLDAAVPGSDAARDLGELSNLTGTNMIRDAQKLSAAKSIGTATAKTMLKRSAVGAGAGAGIGVAAHEIGLPGAAAIATGTGAAVGAITSPYALKQGIRALNSPAAGAIGQPLSALGAHIIKQSGNSGVKTLEQNK